MLLKFQVRLLLLLLVCFTTNVFAQPVLPDIVGATDKGINVLSWTSQYDGLKSIAVQRSNDSVYNFKTVGYVKNLKKGAQAFIDGHPEPGTNWYRLYIVFSSDLTWYSNRYKLFVDSATLMKKGVLPPNDSLQKLATKIKVETTEGTVITKGDSSGTTTGAATISIPKIVIDVPQPEDINAYSYIKSQHVFTNPFTGHVNLELSDYGEYAYSVRFYDQNNKEVLEIPTITEPQIILDKRNFKKKGLYKFILRQGFKDTETGYITIY